MSSLHVLFARVRKDYIYQFRIWKNIIDWTVMLYILIPALVAAVIIYRSWWLDLPAWSSFVSLPLIASAVYILSWVGTFRLFVKEADGIFYLKHRSSFIEMKRWAFSYAIVKIVLEIILLVVVLLPFLMKVQRIDLLEFVSLLFYWKGVALFIRALHMKLRFSINGWIQNLMAIFMFVLFFIGNLLIMEMTFVFLGVAGVMLTGITLLFMRPIISTLRFFEEECLLENEQKLRFVSMIFGVSNSVEKPRVIKRRRPLMFRSKIFRKRNAQNGFNELFFKIFIRNFTFVGGYFRLVAVTAGAVILLPPILKAAVGVLFCFFISIWINGAWDKILLANPIGKRYEEHPDYYRAKQKTAWIFTILAAVILCLAYIVSKLLF
ncbi:ABC transporter permease [Bacillus sp. AGMB 02131]|uniref:ABC transporter permease n=1 Tax=Peribacillus faecalis TaxID=2772559 RepID=A0A927CWN0_9BACI|nr:ABC transporter permease [Peribacillus faecalis]MBD3108931.1 ABC transporter permease [Peribacillus faecalis]